MNKQNTVLEKVTGILEESVGVMLDAQPLLRQHFENEYTLLYDSIIRVSQQIREEAIRYANAEKFTENKKLASDTIQLKDYREGVVQQKDFFQTGNIDYTQMQYAIENESDPVFIVFPARNSEDTIEECMHYVWSDLKRSTAVMPIYLIAINNTTDNSIESALGFIERNPDISYVIYEFKPETNASLPLVLNMIHNEQRKKLISKGMDLNKFYFMYVDDDARVLCNEDGTSMIGSHITLLKEDPILKVISGQSIDEREVCSIFHKYATVSNRKEVTPFMKPKPYCHGGAGGSIMRFIDYPSDGLPLDGLGGINLNTEVIADVNPTLLLSIPFDKWITRTNPQYPCFHPTPTNIFGWSCTYLGYQIAWRRAFYRLSTQRANIYRDVKHKSKINMLETLTKAHHDGYFSLDELVGYMLIKWFYLPILRNQNEVTYPELKTFTSRHHDNL